MPNNPVQIVLNTDNFQVLPNAGGGGPVKDFYQGRDGEFAAHRDKLLADLDQIAVNVNRPGGAALEYVHVNLEADAWAKTRRPTQQIFPPARVPLVGGDTLGDMIVELTPETIDFVKAHISAAEVHVPIVENKKTKELKPKPSRARGEVGAIRELRPHRAADRRRFSVKEAVDWLSDPRTGGMYMVATFVRSRAVREPAVQRARARAIAAFEQLKTSLQQSGLPLTVRDTAERWNSVQLLLLHLDSKDITLHEQLLRLLDEHPIVRRVMLPPILSVEHVRPTDTGAPAANIGAPQAAQAYPVLGIVDTGAAVLAPLEPWCAGRTDLLARVAQNRAHGTFIAGLSAAAHTLNSHAVFGELPCRFFDLGLHPTNDATYGDFYPRGFIDFLEQLDAEIPAAKAAGARVFNMSLSLNRQVEDDGYGAYAALLDEIADKHDVIFVLPAGNLPQALHRPQWPNESTAVAEMLAGYRYPGQDRIFQPAESVRAISVGALDPPEQDGRLRPAVYTRRGPSTALGIKPDISHVGGCGLGAPNLLSLAVNGAIAGGCGTSYAAPLAGKSLAALNHAIEGTVDRETLVGLLVHHARLPAPLDHAETSRYARDFVGHGIPLHATDMLVTDDHSITLVFVGTLTATRELVFPITWPVGLVSADGKCRGHARMTLAYRAMVDQNFGAEYVRVNLDAHLRQEVINEEGEVGWKGQLKTEGKMYERKLIESAHKWWPVKRYDRTFPSGIGESSQWRLVVDSLCRTDTEFPPGGIPFSVILTIEDPAGDAPVFNELRQTLRSNGAQIGDLRTALRIAPRA